MSGVAISLFESPMSQGRLRQLVFMPEKGGRAEHEALSLPAAEWLLGF
jgi:hypothetical protein